MFEIGHDKDCQEEGKSVIHSLSRQKQLFTESHTILHSISRYAFGVKKVLSKNRVQCSEQRS
jgi:hypothetical protein